ncbi:MAG: hypothetical protein R6U26_02755 [Candidatus Undinarchaeales archaeon]
MTTRVRIAKVKEKGYEGLTQELVQEVQPVVQYVREKFSGKIKKSRRHLTTPPDVSSGFYIDIECKSKKIAVGIAKIIVKKIKEELDEDSEKLYVGVRGGGGRISKGEYRSIKEILPDEFKS